MSLLPAAKPCQTRCACLQVMPKHRITIHSTYVYCDKCEREAAEARHRVAALTKEVERHRSAQLPGN